MNFHDLTINSGMSQRKDHHGLTYPRVEWEVTAQCSGDQEVGYCVYRTPSEFLVFSLIL